MLNCRFLTAFSIVETAGMCLAKFISLMVSLFSLFTFFSVCIFVFHLRVGMDCAHFTLADVTLQKYIVYVVIVVVFFLFLPMLGY